MYEFVAILVTLMMALPSYHTDKESKVARQVRVTTIAVSIHRATDRATCQGDWNTEDCVPRWKGSKEDLGILLVTLAFWESRLAQHVHEGKCLPGYIGKDGKYHRGECDEKVRFDRHGNVIARKFKARTIWQLQKHGYTAPEWDVMVGTSQVATDAAAWAAAKTLSMGYRSCGNVWGAISVYAGAGGCTYEKSKVRLNFYHRLKRKYQTEKDSLQKADVENQSIALNL